MTKIVTLLELMRECNVYSLVMLLHHIDNALASIQPIASNDAMRKETLNEKEADLYLDGIILHAQIAAKELLLESTYNRVWVGGGPFWMASKAGITWQEAESELRFLRQSIEADCEKRTFVFVMPDRAALVFKSEMEKEWSRIWEAIPDAKSDIVEAVYSFALERDTAAVFHLMRAVEWGLRAFCHHLGRLDTKVARNDGTVKLKPIEYSTWDDILKALWGDVEKKLNQVQTGPERQRQQEFYNQSLLDLEGFKDAWRNHVMHTRKSFLPEDVRSIMSHAKRFMDRLVDNGVIEI